jgi:hypothetical protein
MSGRSASPFVSLGRKGSMRPCDLLGRLRPRPPAELDARGAEPHDVDSPGEQLRRLDRAPAAVHDPLELAPPALLHEAEPAEVDDAGDDGPGRPERDPQLLRVLVDPALDLTAADEVHARRDVGEFQRRENGEEPEDEPANSGVHRWALDDRFSLALLVAVLVAVAELAGDVPLRPVVL